MVVAARKEAWPNRQVRTSLSLFKYGVSHIRGAENVVADCLSRQFEEPLSDVTFSGLLLDQLPRHSIRSRNIKKGSSSTWISMQG
jgi:hypothetical protein